LLEKLDELWRAVRYRPRGRKTPASHPKT
jgi:hypothetical protein